MRVSTSRLCNTNVRGRVDGVGVSEANRLRQHALVYTPEEAAQVLKIGRTKIYELLHCGKLRSVRIGRTRRIPVAALESFLEEQQEVRVDDAV